MVKIGWTQPLCEPCYVAWCLGRDELPRQPTRVIGAELVKCLVCGTPTDIYTRIKPALAEQCPFPMPDSDQ